MTIDDRKEISVGIGMAAFVVLVAVSLSVVFSGCEQPKPAPQPPAVNPVPVVVPSEPTPDIPEYKDAPGGIPPMGYSPDKEGTQKFLRSLSKPTIREAGPNLEAEKTDPVLLYRALYKAHQDSYGTPWKTGTQAIGDCVSWGTMHAVATSSAVDYVQGNVSEWKLCSTEAIYGLARVEGAGRSTCPGGDGSYGGASAKGIKNFGVIPRGKYEKFDLTEYSGSRAKDWGYWGCGGKGDNGWADELAKKHPVMHVALVTNFDEAAAAIENGYAIFVCSGQGFRSTRDKDGFCAASGSWSHCMSFHAVRYDRPGLLCLNSWGETWVSGPKWPDDQPNGSFWVDKSFANRMLGGEDSFAVSGPDGFQPRELNNADWLSDCKTVEQGQYALAP